MHSTSSPDGADHQNRDTRVRRALYRAHHRGTKEMDWLVGRYADGRIADMTDEELSAFENMLQLPDPDLYRWIMEDPADAPDAIAAHMNAIREFNKVA